MHNIFSQFPEIFAACSDVSDGNMSFKRPEPGVLNHRTAFLGSLGTSMDQLVCAEQPHGTLVRVVGAAEQGMGSQGESSWLAGVEGMITQAPGLTLGVTIADCMPVFLYDTHTRTVGLLHAGWRSTLAGVIASALVELDRIGVQRSHTHWYIGPHIQQCCFSVKEDVLAQFSAYPEHLKNVAEGTGISLSGILSSQLLRFGISSANVDISRDCTCHDTRWYSYRRSQGNLVGSQLAVIGLKNE